MLRQRHESASPHYVAVEVDTCTKPCIAISDIENLRPGHAILRAPGDSFVYKLFGGRTRLSDRHYFIFAPHHSRGAGDFELHSRGSKLNPCLDRAEIRAVPNMEINFSIRGKYNAFDSRDLAQDASDLIRSESGVVQSAWHHAPQCRRICVELQAPHSAAARGMWHSAHVDQ